MSILSQKTCLLSLYIGYITSNFCIYNDHGYVYYNHGTLINVTLFAILQ